jgi:hypothetical protein
LPTIRASVSRVDRFAGGKDGRFDAVHPFAPARLRRQVIQFPVKQLVS